MTILNKNIKVRNLGFNQVATIVVPSYNTWKSEVQNDKGFRIKLVYPTESLNPPEKIRVTVSTCKGFVDLTSDSSSVTMNRTGSILECVFDITAGSAYVNLNPNVTHFINIKCLIGNEVNFDVELSSFDVAGDIVTCSSGPVTPGFVFTPVSNPDKTSVIREFSLGQVASLTIPPRNSADWGTAKPNSVQVRLSHIDGLPAPGKWEMIISECPGSFEESLTANVGSANDYHIISSKSTGIIDIDYNLPAGPPVSKPGPTCTRVPDKLGDVTDLTNLESFIRNMSSDQVGAIRFKASNLPKYGINVRVAETTGQNPPEGMQVAISECPADFDNIPAGNESNPGNCVLYGDTSSIALKLRSGGSFAPYECRLDPSKTYYVNVRFKNPSTNQGTCSSGTCGVAVLFGYTN